MYKIVVNLLPPDATLQEKYQVLTLTHDQRESLMQSADDAAGLVTSANAATGSKVVVWGPERWTSGDIIAWLKFRGVAQVETRSFPGSLGILDVVDSLPRHPSKTYETRPLSKVKYGTIHHTVGISTPVNIAHYHINHNNWAGIGYHWVVMPDGTVYWVNRLETKSFHAGSYAAPGDENEVSFGVALVGNFMTRIPPRVQLDAARFVVAYARAILPADEIYVGHGGMPGASTACPGATWPRWLTYVTGESNDIFPGAAIARTTAEMEVCEAAIPDDFLS